MKLDKRVMAALSITALSLLSPAAHAEPGDVLRITTERVNLRAGPSDDTNIRSQVTKGEEVVELKRSGQWVGVRALRTGEEGWIFAELLELGSRSTLDGRNALPTTAGFAELSRDFDQVIALVAQSHGIPLFDRVKQGDRNELEVTTSPEWFRAGSMDEHIMGALSIHQMWKNHQNGAPVRVVMLEPGGRPYISIDETAPTRPILSVAQPRD